MTNGRKNSKGKMSMEQLSSFGRRGFAVFLAVTILATASFGATQRMAAVQTVPHDFDCLLKSGHIQGACCSEQGIYLSHSLGVEKIGWDGRLVKHIDVPGHLGDSAYANGKVYGAFVVRNPKDRVGGKPGLVRVWDENLNQLAEAWYDEPLDGIVVLGDTVYVGVDKWGTKPHAMCCVKRLGLDLADRGNVDIDLGYWIRFGVQTMATDGTSLFFGNYGASADKGNPSRYNCTRLTPDLRVVGNMKFFCSEGFCLVPQSVSKREDSVFLAVRAMGGNMQGWREDPVNNPPRIQINFYEFKDDKFASITTDFKN